MKRLAAIAAAAALLLSLCACGMKTENAAAEKAPVQLKVVTSFGLEDGNRDKYESAVAEYEQLSGNVIIDRSDVSSEEWKAKTLADFETGSEPDVLFFFANADAEPLIHAGKVVSIDEIRGSFPDYASNMDESKLPRAGDGKCYAVPIMGYWEYLYVNKAVLADCGLELPGRDYSWESFIRDCSEIKKHGYTPIACSLAEVSHYWFEFAVMNNGSLKDHPELPELDADGRLVDNKVSEKWIAGLEDLRGLYESGFFPANTLTVGDTETVAMFGDGRAAFLIDGSWKVGYFNANYSDRLSDFAVCYVPAKGERQAEQTVGGISTGFFITRRAWNDPAKREAAVAFVSLMTSDRIVRSFASTELTALKSVTVPDGLNPLQLSAAYTLAGTEEMVGAVQDSISVESRAALFSSIRNVVTGELSAHDAVELAMQLNR